MKPLVSILIPAYNAKKTIEDTIQSALAQTWPNKEIIIVNDGSSDNTLTIARKFESRYLKVITQTNKGASNARNRALDVSQGDFIQWLDADDLLAQDKIEFQLTNTDDNPKTRVLYSSAWGRFYFRPQKAKFNPDPLWQDLFPLNWLQISLGEGYWMHPSSWLVSRKLTDLAGPWNEKLLMNQDGEYFFRVVAASKLVKFNRAALCYYRIGNFSSISSNRSNKALESYIFSLNCCIDHLLSLDNSENTKNACINSLQNFINIFRPEDRSIISIVHQRISDLGGIIKPPVESWKFLIIQKILGMKTAMLLKKLIYRMKIFLHLNLDKLLATLSNNSN